MADDKKSVEENSNEARTTIDDLLNLIDTKGKTELSKLASETTLPESILEDWAKILEKGGLVNITYELGKMYISPSSMSKEQRSGIAARINIEEETFTAELQAKLAQVRKFSEDIENLKHLELEVSKTYSEKMPTLKEKLDEINKVYEQVNEENRTVAAIKTKIEEIYDNVNKKVGVLSDKIKYLSSDEFEQKMDEAIEKANQINDYSSKFEQQIKEIEQEKNKNFVELNNMIDKQVAEMKKEIKKKEEEADKDIEEYKQKVESNNKLFADELKEGQELIKEMKEFKKDKEKYEKILDDNVKDFVDKYTKSHSIIENGIKLLNARATDMMNSIISLKENFGSISKVYDETKELQNNIIKAEAGLKEINIELDKLAKDIEKLHNTKTLTEENKLNIIQKLSEKNKNINEKIEEVKADIHKSLKNDNEALDETKN
ncbi:MAG: hypothetical protein QXI95_00710 [Candidatus Micrarchaeaceae archaeon]